MKLGEALRILHNIYPTSEIKTLSTSSGQMILKDDTFLAWICEGEVDTALIQYLEKGQRISSNSEDPKKYHIG